MATLTIRYNLSETGRRASLLAGGNGKREQILTVPVESPQFAAAVALAAVTEDGTATVRADQLGTGTGYYRTYDTPQTADALLADMASEAEAKRVASVEAVARTLAEPLADQVTREYGSSGWYGITPTLRNIADWPELAGRVAEARAEAARLNLILAAEEVAAKAEAAKLAEVKAAKSAEAKAFLAEWVQEHGSELSRLRLAEGYDCWYSSALTEWSDAAFLRVVGDLEPAEDLPDTDGSPVAEPRNCPTVAEIVALKAIRERIAGEAGVSASLTYVRYDRASDSDDEDTPDKQHRTELEVKITRPDGVVDTCYYLIPEEAK